MRKRSAPNWRNFHPGGDSHLRSDEVGVVEAWIQILRPKEILRRRRELHKLAEVCYVVSKGIRSNPELAIVRLDRLRERFERI